MPFPDHGGGVALGAEHAGDGEAIVADEAFALGSEDAGFEVSAP